MGRCFSRRESECGLDGSWIVEEAYDVLMVGSGVARDFAKQPDILSAPRSAS